MELNLDELPYWTSEEDVIKISKFWPTSVTKYHWTGGTFGSEVIVYDVDEGGHVWPGGTQVVTPTTVGAQTYLIDATDQLWKHFSQHQLPMETSVNISQKAINISSNGVIKVTIPSTAGFDATAVDPNSVRFGPAGARPVRHNILGNGNMILHFRVQDTGIQAGDTTVKLTGKSSVDGAFFGSDSIMTVP